MRRFLVLLLFLLVAPPVLAQCQGRDLIADLPGETQAALRAAADGYPFARGNFWQARKGDQTIYLVGTYHLDDPRHAAALQRLKPVLDKVGTLLVEAGPEEERALKNRMAQDPSAILITEGPTLVESLPAEVWAKLRVAMTSRGIPAFMAAKLRPWYVSMMLSIPPCAIEAAATTKGLDGQLIETALAQGISVRALEPYDTLLGIFDTLSPQDQLEMITTTLATEDEAEDMTATLADGYFAGDSRLIWEFERLIALDQPGATPEKVDADFAEMEDLLMARRNRSWIAPIEAAAAKGPILVAFGALHLSGEDGVLNLLTQDGYDLTALPLP